MYLQHPGLQLTTWRSSTWRCWATRCVKKRSVPCLVPWSTRSTSVRRRIWDKTRAAWVQLQLTAVHACIPVCPDREVCLHATLFFLVSVCHQSIIIFFCLSVDLFCSHHQFFCSCHRSSIACFESFRLLPVVITLTDHWMMDKTWTAIRYVYTVRRR